MKAVNRAVANEFHAWQREHLPGTLVIQDLDAWGVVASEDHEPTCLVELKRSSIEPREWRPFAADRPNYASLLRLAERAGVPLLVVYWRKGAPIGDETEFHVFELTEAVPEYHGRRRVVTAREFRERFPRLFLP